MEKPTHLHSPINPPSGNERKDDHEEHTRQLLFEILRQRGVDIDSETGKKIDDKSDIETPFTCYTKWKEEEREAT